jgi:hypothetical protein
MSYSISARNVTVHAPTIDEVKLLFAFALGEVSPPVQLDLRADEEAQASRDKLTEVLVPATVAQPFVGSRTYVDGDSALFGTKVFTRVNGEWVDPSVLTVAEHVEAGQMVNDGYHTGGPFPGETQPDPKLIFGAHSTAGAEASTTAPEVTPAATSIPTPPGVPAPPVATSGSEAPPVVPAPPSPAADVDRDRRGLPWDPRIHSSAKSKTQDGSWKKLRGVDAALVLQVEAELFAAGAAPVKPVVPAIDVSEPEFVPPPPPAATTEASDTKDFPELVARLSELQSQSKIDMATINACAMVHGINSLPLLATRPELVEPVWAEIAKVLSQ